MTKRLSKPSRLALDRARIVLAAACIFVVDTTTRVDIVVAVLYVVIVLLAVRTGRKTETALTGLVSVGLTVVSFLATVETHPTSATAFVNCGLSVLAIASVTLLSLRALRAQTDARRDRDRVAQILRGISMRELTASIVHEITQPVAAIGADAGAASRWLALTPPDVHEAKAAASRIVDQVGRASEVVGRLRTFVARGAIVATRCNLAVAIEATLSHLRQDLDEATIEVEVTAPRDVDVEADSVLLQQVLIGAFTNAVEALMEMPSGARRMSIRLEPRAGQARLAIRDTGPGATNETIEHMFDPFFTTKAERGGMGIGLAVSRTIIDAHGGSISAAANQPQGLVLTIVLPLSSGRGAEE